jgi:uncharacterized protein YjbJ (UPF0337 family)
MQSFNVYGKSAARAIGTRVASTLPVDDYLLHKESIMGREDIAAGQAKQIKGKVNDVAGAVKGDTAQQIKGKVQKGVGKIQEKLGRASK